MARMAAARADCWRLGAVGAVPGGMGIVDGGKIPYKPEAAKISDENRQHWIERDPEINCYLAGCPTRDLHAVPVPDSAESEAILHHIRVRRRLFAISTSPIPDRRKRIPGWASPSAAGTAIHWSWMCPGFNDQTWFDRSGTHHSNKLRVVERYT